jgi:hypothetical protein
LRKQDERNAVYGPSPLFSLTSAPLYAAFFLLCASAPLREILRAAPPRRRDRMNADERGAVDGALPLLSTPPRETL